MDTRGRSVLGQGLQEKLVVFAARSQLARRHHNLQSVLRRLSREDYRICGLLIADKIKDLLRPNISIVIRAVGQP